MTLHLGNVPAGGTLYIPFASFDAAGASVTLSDLAATDIEIYKNGSTTQRASDAGYALLDTDGIDFDELTGINGFSVDLSDNTDSGFYSVGGFYWVIVSSVTIDGETVNFIAATFRIVAAEHTAGYPVATIKDGTGTGELDTASGVVLAKDHTGAALATAADLATVATYVDTEVAAIKAKTDNLPADTASVLTTIEGKIDTIDSVVDAIPDANSNADALLGRSDGIETGYTLADAMRIALAALAGKSSGHGTGTVVYRDINDTTDRIVAEVDAGNRTSVTLDASV